ncbi:LOB domain-containing protein 33-like isoform X2 [Rhododendron vialii]|uniref:LOB domain-containing protein 33-like isoform X2 n=1 Tax=Rhododendron vialii TaxID=182163 RepID=UPI00265FBC71|nr:LOB domain-containing protein 33-like isoform X2 [Rhododendron vialii]
MTGVGSSCGACKFLRRRCTSECVFAPYFCYDEAAAHFAAVHKVFGASNVSKLLSYLPQDNRSKAATSISYEALARMHDPVYGCVAHIIVLQQQEEIETLENQMGNLGVDASFGSSQAIITNSFTNELQQVGSQHHQMNRQTYLSQETTPLSHEVMIKRYANSQMIKNMQLPITDGLEGQNYINSLP